MKTLKIGTVYCASEENYKLHIVLTNGETKIYPVGYMFPQEGVEIKYNDYYWQPKKSHKYLCVERDRIKIWQEDHSKQTGRCVTYEIIGAFETMKEAKKHYTDKQWMEGDIYCKFVILHQKGYHNAYISGALQTEKITNFF